jgi:hypothetical protein
MVGGGNIQSGTNTTSILCQTNPNLLTRPRPKNLITSLKTHGHILGIKLDKTPISPNINRPRLTRPPKPPRKITHRRNRTSSQPSRPPRNRIRHRLYGPTILQTGRRDAELVDDDVMYLCEVGGRVCGDGGHGGCVDAVLFVEGLGGVADEELGFTDEGLEGLTEDFAEEHSRDAFFKHLEAGVDTVVVDHFIVCSVLHHVQLPLSMTERKRVEGVVDLVIECSPFHVDDHGFETLDVMQFGDILDPLDVCSIRPRSKYGTDQTSPFSG